MTQPANPTEDMEGVKAALVELAQRVAQLSAALAHERRARQHIEAGMLHLYEGLTPDARQEGVRRMRAAEES